MLGQLAAQQLLEQRERLVGRRDAHLVGTDARRFHDDHLVAARCSPDDPVDEASTAWEIGAAESLQYGIMCLY